MDILLSLSSTSVAFYSCVAFAAAALANDGVGDNSVWRWWLSRSGCFSYDTRDGNAAGAEPLADTGDDSLADTEPSGPRHGHTGGDSLAETEPSGPKRGHTGDHLTRR